MSAPLLVLAPLRIEQAALHVPPGARVLRTGMGPAKARIAAARALAVEAGAVAVAGVAGGVSPQLRPGDIVCATELRCAGEEPISVPGSTLLANELRQRGLHVHVGAVESIDHIAGPAERERLVADGLLAVDMESWWLAAAAEERPLAVLRVIADAAGRHLFDPRMLVEGGRSLVALRRASEALGEWADLARVTVEEPATA